MLLSPELSINLNETTWQALDQSLEHVDREIQKAAEEFLLDAARVMLDEIRQEAPRSPSYRGETERARYGKNDQRLANSFHSTFVQHRGDHLSIAVYEDATQDSGWNGVSVGELVEGGTKAHEIKPVHGQALAFHWGAGTVPGLGPGKSPRGKLFVNPKFAAGQRHGKGNTIARKPGGFPRTKSDSTLFFFKRVHHPGTAPNPFFARAVAQAIPKIEALRERIIEKVKFAWGGGN